MDKDVLKFRKITSISPTANKLDLTESASTKFNEFSETGEAKF